MSVSLPKVPSNGRCHASVPPILEQASNLCGTRLNRIAFIEKKFRNLRELGGILHPCAKSRQWTNFDPISCLLESALARDLNLHPSRTIVMCSSATAALLTITAMKNYRAGRRLRWVISADGFRSTLLWPLADGLVLDCNKRAMLDLDRIARPGAMLPGAGGESVENRAARRPTTACAHGPWQAKSASRSVIGERSGRACRVDRPQFLLELSMRSGENSLHL